MFAVLCALRRLRGVYSKGGDTETGQFGCLHAATTEERKGAEGEKAGHALGE